MEASRKPLVWLLLLLLAVGVSCSLSGAKKRWTRGGSTNDEPTVVVSECGFHVMAPNTRNAIQTPNFPNDYHENFRCQWEFHCNPRENTTLEMICPTFELQDSANCNADRLIVKYRGEREVHCGTNSPDGTITTDGWMRLTFWSDIVIGTTAKGFRCFIWCRPKENTIVTPCIC